MPNGCSSKPWPQHERARAGILGAASKSLYPYLHMTSPASPIGVFDSGIGGLSVLQALRHELPHERFVYLADSGKDRKSTRLNSSHLVISYAVFCLKKKKTNTSHIYTQHVH